MNKFTKTALLLGVLVLTLIPIGASAQEALSISIDKSSASLVAGEWLDFQTTVANEGNIASPPLVAHFNVASLKPGKHVDPEDWSPERTQYLDPLQPGESVTLDWRVHTLFEGDFAVFVSLVSEDTAFGTVSSPALQIHAVPDDVLPMKQVIPVVVAVPLFPFGLLILTKVLGRKKI